MYPNPCNEVSQKNNAPDLDLRAPQSRKIIADKVMDWMESQNLSISRAADAIGISNQALVTVTNRGPIHSRDFIKMNAVIPGLTDHYNLGED